MKNKLVIFTPVNPKRPYSEYLNEMHNKNVVKNICCCPVAWNIKYLSAEVYFNDDRQKQGLYRGQNVVREFNDVYNTFKNTFQYICKWDDDIVLPDYALGQALDMLESDISTIGVGLFSTQYGAPRILMTNPETEGFTNSFQRFYIYRMNAWKEINVDDSGDPDQAYQWSLEGKKQILNIPHIHLDHRATKGNDDLYRVLLDLARFTYFEN